MGGHFADYRVGIELFEAKPSRIVAISQPFGIDIIIGPCIIVTVVATIPCAIRIEGDGVVHLVAYVLIKVVKHLDDAYTPKSVVARIFEICTQVVSPLVVVEPYTTRLGFAVEAADAFVGAYLNDGILIHAETNLGFGGTDTCSIRIEDIDVEVSVVPTVPTPIDMEESILVDTIDDEGMPRLVAAGRENDGATCLKFTDEQFVPIVEGKAFAIDGCSALVIIKIITEGIGNVLIISSAATRLPHHVDGNTAMIAEFGSLGFLFGSSMG